MARTKKTAAKNADPVIVRNTDINSLEKRVYNMDGAKIRNYDLFSLEKRIYDLEVNGGGGGGSSVKMKTGTFTSASTQYGIVTVSDVGFKPDLLMVFLPFGSNDTCSYWEKYASWAETRAIWALMPAESVCYSVLLGRTSGETGIQAINDDGFSFMSKGANTQGVECRYIAINYGE